MELGAISEDGVPMAYAHKSGIRYATQFHPEHYYRFTADSSSHQKTLLDNFIDIAISHHDSVHHLHVEVSEIGGVDFQYYSHSL